MMIVVSVENVLQAKIMSTLSKKLCDDARILAVSFPRKFPFGLITFPRVCRL